MQYWPDRMSDFQLAVQSLSRLGAILYLQGGTLERQVNAQASNH